MAPIDGVLRAVLIYNKIFNPSRWKNTINGLNQFRKCSTSAQKKENPIKFSTSDASKMKISKTLRLNPHENIFWFERHVVFGSIAALLYYYCIYRKEHYLDHLLTADLEKQTNEVQYVQLKILLQYCQKNGCPTKPIEEKLKKIKKNLEV